MTKQGYSANTPEIGKIGDLRGANVSCRDLAKMLRTCWTRRTSGDPKGWANSPAALGGIKEGDLVIRLGDCPISGIDDLQRHLTMSQVGIRTAVSLIRGTDQLQVEIVPAEAAH